MSYHFHRVTGGITASAETDEASRSARKSFFFSFRFSSSFPIFFFDILLFFNPTCCILLPTRALRSSFFRGTPTPLCRHFYCGGESAKILLPPFFFDPRASPANPSGWNFSRIIRRQRRSPTFRGSNSPIFRRQDSLGSLVVCVFFRTFPSHPLPPTPAPPAPLPAFLPSYIFFLAFHRSFNPYFHLNATDLSFLIALPRLEGRALSSLVAAEPPVCFNAIVYHRDDSTLSRGSGASYDSASAAWKNENDSSHKTLLMNYPTNVKRTEIDIKKRP